MHNDCMSMQFTISRLGLAEGGADPLLGLQIPDLRIYHGLCAVAHQFSLSTQVSTEKP
jgi:hypothetical protein